MDGLDIAFRFLPILISITALSVTIGIFRAGARKDALEKLSARIDAVDKLREADTADGRGSREKVAERLTAVEQTLAHMPDKDTVHKLAIDVTEIRGDLKAQGKSMEAVTDNLRSLAASGQRIEDYLLKASR
jgi:uncharacterized coiled-coil protein SlyX